MIRSIRSGIGTIHSHSTLSFQVGSIYLVCTQYLVTLGAHVQRGL